MPFRRFHGGSKVALELIENAGLIIIALATIVASIQEVMRMIGAETVTLGDLLLMFIYLEVLAMVGIYLESHRLPVRLPMYIAIVALARYLILDIKEMDPLRILGVASAILLIAISVLVVRFGHVRLPYENMSSDRPQTGHPQETTQSSD